MVFSSLGRTVWCSLAGGGAVWCSLAGGGQYGVL
jgi:hypothetical protein